jgi:hypothetical protein
MAVDKAKAILRGYARNEADERRLRAAGVRTIYRADKGEVIGKFKMRHGELLGVVDSLRAFGEAKGAMVAATKAMAAFGAAIVDIDTGLRSDRDGAEMLYQATTLRNLSAAAALAMQGASVKARTKGRLSETQARRVWKDGRYSVAEALELMTGWSQRAAYQHFGKRDVGAGRRPR